MYTIPAVAVLGTLVIVLRLVLRVAAYLLLSCGHLVVSYGLKFLGRLVLYL